MGGLGGWGLSCYFERERDSWGVQGSSADAVSRCRNPTPHALTAGALGDGAADGAGLPLLQLLGRHALAGGVGNGGGDGLQRRDKTAEQGNVAQGGGSGRHEVGGGS